MTNKPYLQKVKFTGSDENSYPHNLSSIKNIQEIEFKTPVTFLVGENGVGKSTIVEAIAVAMGLNAEGGNKNTTFETEATHSDLYKTLKLVKGAIRPKDWFFLRAESFYNVASLMDEVGYLGGYGGKSLHHQSHGEAFMAVLSNKLAGNNGFYIFDEPEAALSGQRQLNALAEIHRLVKSGSQLIIATHSPILMGYPNSTIYEVSENGIEEVDYEDTENYQVTKAFLTRKDMMLESILQDD
ncbi:MAG TPA: AAA family ATPase [Alphaproteobacteria bacterium]|nr:AAA family ATPase [Alphaproteobacteria bacterium]